MGRKRNPYIQLFTRDILSSPRCRALSESAAGVYLFLLCRLNEPPMPGAYRLRDWEPHPTWKRSCTQQCLVTPDKQARLQYFAKMLSKNDLPWKTATILGGLQELYRYGIITVEGDMLVQPRMYKDNGFELPDIDNDGDPVGTILDDPASGSMALRGDDDFNENKGANNGAEKSTGKGTEKVHRKVHVSHAHATRTLSVENMRNNNMDKGNIGVVGGDAPDANQIQKPCKNEKTEENNPAGGKDPSKREKSPETINSTPDAQKPVSGPENNKDVVSVDGDAAAKIINRKSVNRKSSVADNPPTLEDIQAYMDERAQQGKPFVYVTAEGFLDACEQSGWTLKDGKPIRDWRARLRTFETYRKEHGDRPVAQRQGGGQAVTPLTSPKPGDPIPATKPSKGKYKNKW
jgi:hypothetical protein